MHHPKTMSLKRAFILTVSAAGVAAGASGCETQVSVNPPAAVCPDAPPSGGDACTDPLTCDYGTDACGYTNRATCNGGVWTLDLAPPCNPPPPPQCPVEIPALGAQCEADSEGMVPMDCVYTMATPCGDQQVIMSCEAATQGELPSWVFSTAPTCEALPEECQGYAESTACDTDPGCVWRVPSCSATVNAPDVVAGCYAVDDCDVDPTACGAWGTCQLLSYDPCWNSLCNACGAQASMCVPNP
jgi:hypothetical protein